MAAPSLISGIAGVVPGSVNRGGDYSSVGNSISQMMDRLVQMHEYKQDHASQQLERMVKAVEAGFPIDPKAITKTAKQAGMPIMNPQDMKANQAAAKNPGGPQTSLAPTESTLSSGGKVQATEGNPVASVNKSLSNQDAMKSRALDMWYNNAMQIAQKKGMTQQALMDYGLKVADLKNQAASGDRNAVGKLMSLNEIPFSLDRATWEGASDDQKHAMIEIAAGHETDAQFSNRRDRIYESLMTSGKFKDPAAAMKGANALAHGADMSSDATSAMQPYTFGELSQQADFGMKLLELGVPSNQVNSVARAASVGGLQNALPTGLKPLVMQQLDLERSKVGEQARHDKASERLEAGRLGLEGERVKLEAGRMEIELAKMNSMAAKMDLMMKDEARKADFDQFRSLVELKKAGTKIDQTILDQAQAKVGQHMGVEVKEVNNFFHFLTGGTHMEFSPKPASDLANKAAGKQKPEKVEPSTMQKIMKAIKGQDQEDQI